jgi:hypothetical protein
MVLKDWKKRTNEKSLIIYIHTTDRLGVLGVRSSRQIGKTNNDWIFYGWAKDDRNGTNRSFKTKSQALKFAKSYMRKH